MKSAKVIQMKKKDDDFEIKYGVPCPPPLRERKMYSFLEIIKVGGHVIIKDLKKGKSVYSTAGSYGRKTTKLSLAAN